MFPPHSSSSPRLLALGDSYTIGESVAERERWPVQLVCRLRQREAQDFAAPVIIAETGWTTDELAEGIRRAHPRAPFDIVTLLIGVNNQYRGRPLDEYREHFHELLGTAICLAGEHPANVVVVSIPDWGVTPFAQEQERERIGREIDAFNAVNYSEARSAGARYVDVTGVSRRAADEPELLASDGLHPSGRMYAEWAALILPVVSAGQLAEVAG